MTNILVKFWLLRFGQVFVLAGVALGGIELLQRGVEAASWRSVLVWAALAGLLTASVSARWAWKRHCRMAFKDSV